MPQVIGLDVLINNAGLCVAGNFVELDAVRLTQRMLLCLCSLHDVLQSSHVPSRLDSGLA